MSDQPSFGLREVGQISIPVRDLERATGFYQDVLGLTHLFDAPPQMAFFDCGGIRLLLGTLEGEESERPASILYYRVDDIQAAYDILTKRGALFEREPGPIHRTDTYELWMAFLRDSEDNLLALMSEVAVGRSGP